MKRKIPPREIARLFYCDRMTVSNRLKEYKIPIRSNSESRMKYKKFDFSGNLQEKAYLIGFRIGDLNVYQTNIKSELIVARCNTTQSVQIRLMKRLFSKYGKVTVSKGKYSANINCYLNKSFNFLLPKYKKVPLWIGEDTITGVAFIAGYTDAEGNFLLNQLRARFKIDSYDVEILKWIVNCLKNNDIHVKFRQIGKAGDLRSNGTRFKHDIWRLNVNEAFSLKRFMEMIKPFVKHETRLRHIEVCESNIQQRIVNKTIKNETN
ncbi:hypothetical protein A2165_03875 [Candidatus Curtissbacteria bacterium RBG_13_40_7]|uniref:Homing endonuclease LAGLIDADG domain-containing protein n=1 Tax=Candidatus Curtissbacteria bacterium RBG_13_40_7 TaxID=1797706 RepID=A0A1F5FTR3_9BACT|nr:MAG: hypothetical protein A2165_03875 [Candidatus Curtissbacteria bacterium RBG_13_40_7]